MSDHSVAQLTLAIERLTLATNNLSAQLRTVDLSRETTAEPSGSISDPVPSLPRRPQMTVEEELFRVPFPDSFEQHLQASRFGGLEGGPGPLPGCCRQAAADRLSRKPPGADIRAEIAFAAGFWSNIAIETSTPYQPRALLQGTKKQHWIVLRSTFGEPFRTCTWREVQRICDTDHPDFVCEPFETLTEVEIFCFGASSPIPCLRSCTATP
jgi:hypothetical protein